MNEHEDPLFSQLTEDYLAALRLHDENPTESHLQEACDIGKQAAEMGLGTLELAKIHDVALTVILLATDSADRDATTTRAAFFFYEALAMIENTHRGARNEALKLQEINTILNQRTEDLAISQSRVKNEKGDRKSIESALLSSEESAVRLLEESQLLEAKLREMARTGFSANEAEQEQMSLHLQNEIAQSLLGIHVKLMALKKTVSISHENLAEKIAAAQHLMAQAVKAISNFADSLDIQHGS